MAARQAVRVVWFYARRDEGMARELRRLMAVLESQGLMESFSQADILPGQDVAEAMAQHLASADIVVPLLSADFMAEEPLGPASRVDSLLPEPGRVVPVLLRPTLLREPWARLLALPRNGRPISMWRDRDEALLEVAQELQKAIEYRAARKTSAAPREAPPKVGSGAPAITADVAAAALENPKIEAASSLSRPATESGKRLLHLSDLHFGTADEATLCYAQLAADLRQQGCDTLDALIVSGDIVNRASEKEYDAARRFLAELVAGFALAPRSLVLVPGNHDVSWSASEEAYKLHKRSRYPGPLTAGTYREHGADVIEVRDEEAYRERFRAFSDFYRQIKGEDYSLDYANQAPITDLPAAGICVLGLNSAWECDHHFRERASIHMGALSRALIQLGPPPPDRLRVAVFHHPLSGSEESRIKDTAFLQQLAVHGFRLVLHGHVHKADASLYRYDMSAGGRRIEIVTAGTFGAPMRQWVPGYPLQYNLLRLSPGCLTVETRCRREVNGAWEPDARWRQGEGRDPLPRYSVPL